MAGGKKVLWLDPRGFAASLADGMPELVLDEGCETDTDLVRKNMDACLWFLEHYDSIQETLDRAAGGRIPDEEVLGEGGRTGRGFAVVRFKDEYDTNCCLQISSRAVCEYEDGSTDDLRGWLWLGVEDAKPLIMRRDAQRMGLKLDVAPGEDVAGWMPYNLPEEVLLHTSMHLSPAQVAGLVDRLNYWLDNGKLEVDA